MEESDTIITLIGTKLAKVGNEFIFKGGAKECEPCRLNKTCLGLNSGSRYRITALRQGASLSVSCMTLASVQWKLSRCLLK